MSTKRINIEIPKQDYQIISVSIKKDGQTTKLNDSDLIFMTVKNYANSDKILMQKSLENGISYNESTNKYDIEINSIDTKDFLMGKVYGYDITIYYEGDKPKQKALGNFTITDKYTLNEVI